MSPTKPWEPKIEREPILHPFAKVDGDQGSLAQTPNLRNPEEDTAPLQGSKDLSDSDSLEDVIADASEQQPAAAPATESKTSKP